MQSGKTSLLQTWLLALATHCPPSQLHLYLVDSRRLGLAPLMDLPHVRAYADSPELAELTIGEVGRLLSERQVAFDAARRKTDTPIGDVQALAQAPAIVLALDDLLDRHDDLLAPRDDSDNSKSEQWRRQLATMARQGRRLGFHLLVAGPVGQLSRYNEPITTLTEVPIGFRLDAPSDDALFSLRLPYSEREKALPIGQGYWVQRGQPHKVQTATAQVGAPTVQAWVKQLAEAWRKSAANK
ncbi:MAG: segregation ATPase FtsK/SpoIIIE, family [Chloroflexota bacterium]|nr:segregation ATPase FtsK/SpoIIIE, family [Chloroflexota bacterium]